VQHNYHTSFGTSAELWHHSNMWHCCTPCMAWYASTSVWWWQSSLYQHRDQWHYHCHCCRQIYSMCDR